MQGTLHASHLPSLLAQDQVIQRIISRSKVAKCRGFDMPCDASQSEIARHVEIVHRDYGLIIVRFLGRITAEVMLTCGSLSLAITAYRQQSLPRYIAYGYDLSHNNNTIALRLLVSHNESDDNKMR